jgi:hypothetical protein
MRTFEQLSVQEREKALRASRAAIVENVISGVMEIELVNPITQRTLDIILKDAVEKDSPRLAALRIFLNRPILQEIDRLALVVAVETMYDESGNRILQESLQ